MTLEAFPIPVWVRKRDGRTVPFEADKINRALFAATESLGRPDAFVARELTDSVIHFLAQECDGSTVRAAQIEETLTKVVRELGHAPLALAFGAFGRGRDRTKRKLPVLYAGVVATEATAAPSALATSIRQGVNAGEAPVRLLQRSAAEALQRFSLAEVYSKNLVAAHQEGLLELGGLATPLELAAAAARVPLSSGPAAGLRSSWGVFESIEHLRHYVGQTLVLDAPERELAERGARVIEAVAFLRDVRLAARTLGLSIILNLNSEACPRWAEDLAEGPLFAEQRRPDGPERVRGHLDALLEPSGTPTAPTAVRLDCHVADRDFTDDASRQRLLRLARAALSGAAVHFVFDRPRRPVALAEGLDRQQPALLQWVGLGLGQLWGRPETGADLETFLTKLASLARLAASAAVQKRHFLRRRARPECPPFLIDQAHAGIHLVGLSRFLQERFGISEILNEPAVHFVQQLFRRLQQALDEEGGQIHLPCRLDDRGAAGSEPAFPLLDGPPSEWKPRFRAAGRLHATLGRGLLTLRLRADDQLAPVEFVAWLHYAWKHTAVARLSLHRAGAELEQLLMVPEAGRFRRAEPNHGPQLDPAPAPPL